MTDDKILEQARAAFERCVEREADNRAEALDDLRFARLGEQWPAEVRRRREREGRPCLTINRLPAFIRQVVNDARQNKPSISVHPVDGAADPAVAEIMSGLIRQVEQASDADVAYDTALEFAVTCGVGYFRIGTAWARDDGFEQDVIIQRIANPFTVYGDPDSTAADSSDWNSCFVVESLTPAAFEKRWKGKEKVDWSSDAWAGLGAPWFDRGGERVMVAEWWTREEVRSSVVGLSDGRVLPLDAVEERAAELAAAGVVPVGAPREVVSHKVIQRILTGCEVLEENAWPGRFIPIVPVYGEDLNVEGERVLRSLVRDAKDPQRMFNYWRTTSTELVALAPKAPFIGRKGAFETDAEKWASANTDTHAFIEYDGPEAPMRQPFAGVPAGALQEALNAADDLKAIIGLHDASLGARSNETSGRAILARQREGDVSTFHYIDNLSRAIRHAGRVLIDLIPRVYSTARIVRVLGPEGQATGVPVNQPVTVAGVERVFDLGVGKYDLTVTAGPGFTTRRQEAAVQMTEFVRAFPAAAPVLGDLLARNLDWPGADEIARRLQALLPPAVKGAQGGAPDPQVAQLQAVMAQGMERLKALEAENAALKAGREVEAEKLRLEAEKLRIEAFRAETERLGVSA
ncbi:portal protein [Caulobacter sp. 17J80-11]|uniref:portal protein n=1 Tax=Caulobacter sp. 17J80-11 TaxID=2763502 RepID=UPI001653D724|nr:portal protein [Caulobacter sp. 17J80-11]MBC6982131.1 hypothetical protein [Caulobacter sp. 17J80-11]